MATRTFDDIVNEGMLKAGRDDLVDRIEGYFNDWLARQAKSWPWPTLTQKIDFTVPAGTLQFQMVLTGFLSALRFSRVLDEVWLYRTDRSARQRLRIQQVDSAPVGTMDDNGGLNVGLPTNAVLNRSLFSGTEPVFYANFGIRTDREYIMNAPCVVIPPRISDGTLHPWYPEDDTCIQACMYETLKFVNGEDDASTQACLSVLAEMVKADRVRHGVSISQNSVHGLAKGVFR